MTIVSYKSIIACTVWIFCILTHWGRVTHICVSILTIIGPDNGVLPGRHQAIIWTNAGILLNGPLGTNFSEILIKILTFSFNKMHLKVSSAKWQPFSLSFNGLTHHYLNKWLPVCKGHRQMHFPLRNWIFLFKFHWDLFFFCNLC